MSLPVAIEKAEQIYTAEGGVHPIPNDVAAKHLGYSGARNGAAATVLASMKYYGLLVKANDGMVSLPKEFVEFKVAPSNAIKVDIISGWFKSPAIFSELLEGGVSSLPSDETLKYTLVKKGFSPKSADVCLQAFRESLEYIKDFNVSDEFEETISETVLDQSECVEEEPQIKNSNNVAVNQNPVFEPSDHIRLPVNLKDNRMAYIEFPKPFLLADKERLIKYIELQLADDE